MYRTESIANFQSSSETETNDIGVEIYEKLTWPACVYLQGNLGAGKTTLCQSIIAAAGYQGVVTSPTYNLIQEYPVANSNHSELAQATISERTIYHMDLYRLNDAQELHYLGLADLWHPSSLFLVEWPENGNGVLQQPDYIVEINKRGSPAGEAREISFCRCI